MINKEKLNKIIAAYKEQLPEWWIGKNSEIFKWEAVDHFQKHWDIHAENFVEMFMAATDKTESLLVSMNNFPRLMMERIAQSDGEAARDMFIDLYDESQNLSERVEKFRAKAEELRVKYDDGTWHHHYQEENAISTYLWLRYPDKYYIYKYSVAKAFAKAVDSDFVPKKGKPNLKDSRQLYEEIREVVKKDEELDRLLRANLNSECYADSERITLTTDIGFFVYMIYIRNNDDFPPCYSPNISVKDWQDLLLDKSVFTDDSLQIMRRFLDYGGEATCKQLSEKYGKEPGFYNAGSTALAKRIHEKTNCPLFIMDDQTKAYWPILYLGHNAEKGTAGTYVWKLRDELKQALEKTDLSSVKLFDKEAIVDPAPKAAVYTKNDFLKEVYLAEEEYDTLVALLRNKKNLILQGAPGVGKTFAAKRLAYSMMGEADKSRVEFIQFHQNYSYEDFVLGYRPQEEGFKLTEGVFYRFCKKAAADPKKDYFFIIDEINRGNMSKIFGELLLLIEKDYRGTEATLAYSGAAFSVPENLYLIGMMNTADRSLAMIDYALRRRFSFFQMEPGFHSDGFRQYQAALRNETFDELIEQVISLNREINEDASLGPGFCIGHSYFCGQGTCTEDWMKSVVYYDILPMLQEYWFDDKQKVKHWESMLNGVFNG